MVTVEGTDSSLFLSYKAYQKFPGEELILTKWPDVKTSDDKQHIDNIALTNDFNVESITTIPRLTTDGNSRPVRSLWDLIAIHPERIICGYSQLMDSILP